MFNNPNVVKTTGAAPKQILLFTQPQVSVGIVVNQSAGATVGSRKIVKAGTPLTGNLDARTTAFTSAATAATKIGVTAPSPGDPVDVKANVSNANCVLLHDVDVTAGNANGTALLAGYVNTNRLESDVKALITAEVKEALKAKVTFIAE